MQKFIPTMGVKGWTNVIAEKADYMISCFIASNRSSTVSHRDQNTTLQYLLKEYANKMRDLEVALQDLLLKKMQVTFDDTADARVSIVEDPKDPAKVSITFTGIVHDSGQTFTVGQVVQFTSSRITNIAKINNGI